MTVAMKTWYDPDHMRLRAADDSSATVMKSFIPLSAQWLLTEQMYHLFPAVVSFILSFPEVSGALSFSVGLVHSLNPAPSTLNTL
ncbi:hypothetical protein EV1_008462 [Malus domestica]